jgi:hypothetical protein
MSLSWDDEASASMSSRDEDEHESRAAGRAASGLAPETSGATWFIAASFSRRATSRSARGTIIATRTRSPHAEELGRVFIDVRFGHERT